MTATEFRTRREALGWSIPDAMDVLQLGQAITYAYDSGARTTPRHILMLLQIWTADWFPVERRPQPRSRPGKASAPAPVAAPRPTDVAPITLSRRQIKEADRVGGIELIIPYPPHLRAPKLKQGEERDANADEEAYARQALGDLMQHDLVMVRVQVMVDRRPTGLPREDQVEPHLCCIIIGRRWVHATGAKQPKTMWHGG